MAHYTELSELSARGRVLYGAFIAGIGIAMTALMITRQEGLHAPLWVGLLASSCFVLAGFAIALHPFVTARLYNWLMVVLLLTMTAIPVWIALGDGERACRSTVPFFRGDSGCRVGFGIAAVVMVGVVLVAGLQAMQRPAARR